MGFDATPGPPYTLLPATLNKLSSYKVVVDGSVTTAQRQNNTEYACQLGLADLILAFYKQNNHFYTDVDISEEPVVDFSASAFVDAVLDFNDSIPVERIARIDRDQSRVGSESDSMVEDEGGVIERNMVFVNEASSRLDGFQTVTKLLASSSASERRFLVQNSSMFSWDNDGSIYGKCFHTCSRLVVAILEKIALYPFQRMLVLNIIISLTCQLYPTLFRAYDAIT
ncbi:hypothetical protein PHMEG_00016687 [Phytophthora megakarya]|uniref:Uncharacterized protein n=1 Tax=Phytophthora megakarya TaxID=4795 RepID=A0A225VYN1_9STRA|nr:hypothetical protein PHMEG_00016687 [Phytophthora megakarya]